MVKHAAIAPGGRSMIGRYSGGYLMQTQPLLFTSVSFALKWAGRHLDFDSSELLSQAPWARTYKLNGGSESAILKMVPPALVQTSKTYPALAQSFPLNLPNVISEDEQLGLLLLRDHGGQRLDRATNDTQRRAMLQTYAGIQSAAELQLDLLSLFPTVDLRTVVPSLIDFLRKSDSSADPSAKAGAAFFIGRSRARNYRRVLSERAELLEQEIRKAERLPLTISHGDLRPKNASALPDGTIVISNWDDASVGPAGLSLAAFFGRCITPLKLLQAGGRVSSSGGTAAEKHLLNAYIDGLVKGGYATREDIESGLPGAICAGAIMAITWYGNYADEDDRFKRRVGKIIQSRLSDLLDVCDILASKDRSTTLQCALDYAQNRRRGRAEALLRRHLESNRNDAEAHALFSRVLERRGKRDEALGAFAEALELSPDDATLHNDYGRALVESLRLDEGISHLRRAAYLGASGSRLRERLDRATLLRQCERQALDVESVPRLPVSSRERRNAQLRPEALALGAKLFREYGVLQIDNAFDEKLISACREHFLKEYQHYFEANSHEDALSIGHKRFQVTVTLDGPFNEPGLYANPLIMQLMSKLIGRKFHLGCMVCATSLPGSKDQHLHKDHRALFTAGADDPPMYTPPFAITMMVPLVALDEMIGTTTVKKGSHLVTRRESADMPRQLPLVDVGSCFLMDLRLSHQGLGNKTVNVRPIMNMVYQQPWFADNKNYMKQPALRIPRKELEKIPEKHRKLFVWATQPGPDIGR
jgi:hypothetical protein